MAASAGGGDLLRLLVLERFPSWKVVRNEQAASLVAAERRAGLAGPKTVVPVGRVVDQLAARRRARVIKERQKLLLEAMRVSYADADEHLAE